ncbi:phage tail protein I [Rhodopseudomonas palustris]|uniref:Phage tail protein I n=1 Tax=Rhodopseudomonas palustris TaxID=1076 RepID=A0A323UJF2_RHOPL|nr:phage tail protein I [Rhodopseudomonas palustris]PZA12471.1 phage tail protein I [Rhodopseudomonas palustris]
MTEPFPSLLPYQAPAEHCHSLVNAARWPKLFAEAASLRTLWNPWTCPAEQLPLLAWAWSVDFWKPEWPEHRKRQVIAESPAYHEAKTTVAGYRMALGYVDAEFVRARLPRHAFFVGSAPTKESHDRWLAGLPEIRIYTADYPIRYRPVPFLMPDGTIVQRTLKGRFVGRRFVARSAKAVVLGRWRPELRKGGTVQRLVVAGVRTDASGRLLSDPERLVIPGPRRNTFQVGKRLRGRFVADGKLAGQRVILLSFTTGGDQFIPAVMSPGLTPIDATPRKMWEPQPAGRGWFVGMRLKGRGIRPNRADEQAYLSIRLADGSSAELGRMRNRIGRSRIRRKPFTATVVAHIAGPSKRGFPLGRYLRAGPEPRIAEVISALAVTQAARDTLYLDHNSVRPITYGDLARLPDDVRFGAVIRR